MKIVLPTASRWPARKPARPEPHTRPIWSPTRKSLFADSAFTLVLTVAAFTLAAAWNYGQSSRGVDFYQFWVVGQAANRLSTANIYADDTRARLGSLYYYQATSIDTSARRRSAAEQRQVLETYSTPFLYASFRAIASGGYDRDYSMYLLLCLTCSVLAIVGLGQVLGFSAVAIAAAIVAFTAWFEPFRSDLRVGNVNQIQLGVLVLYLWLESRHAWRWRHLFGGVVLGAAVAFKPDVAFVVGALSVAWLVNRRFHKLFLEYCGMAAAAVAAVGVSSVLFGSLRVWSDWIRAATALPNSITTVNLGNYALTRLIFDSTGVDVSVPLTIAVVLIVVGATWIGRRRGQPGSDDELEDQKRALLEDTLMVSLGVAIYLLSARLVWLHYLVLAIPLALLALRPVGDDPARQRIGEILARRVLTVVGITLVASEPITAVFGPLDARLLVTLAIIGLTTLAGLALWDLGLLPKRDLEIGR